MNIPKTILEDFKLCGEPFIIRSNRIYTLESAQGVFDNNDFIQFLDKKYPLEKSLLISNLENRYFSLNEKYINSYLQHIIKRDYVSKVESSHAALISQHNIYEQNKLSSVEHFIRSQVVPQYAELAKDFFQVNSDVPSKPKKIKTVSSETFDPDMFRFPDISDLYSEKSILESVMGSFVNSDFIFTLGGRCYVSSTYDNSPSELVKINNKVHSLKYLSSLSNLDKNYKTAIIRKLNSVAKNHGEQLIPKIQKNLDQIKNLESAFEVQDKTDFGSIGYQKVNNDKYRIYINIVPFIAKMRGKFFHFIKTKVGTDFLIKNNSLEILSAPVVIEKERYYHPFVSSSNSMCYGGNKRWKFTGVEFCKKYHLDSKENRQIAGYKVAAVLAEGWKVIHRGYLKSNSPDTYHPISHFQNREVSKQAADNLVNSGLKLYVQDE